ncbi:hypothetical protein E2C01_022606 [Portunus trituberculatus]|uniref:Uncharacterized protein n=1 Tax=Portunus trituberculatus TaxID=210409 RepID=A0A5B7E7R4_PORTR|nr:hypothetical protein [Portunus trituberculatus]
MTSALGVGGRESRSTSRCSSPGPHGKEDAPLLTNAAPRLYLYVLLLFLSCPVLKSPDPEHPFSCPYLVIVTHSSFVTTSPCDTFIQGPFTLLLTIKTCVVIQYSIPNAAVLIPLCPWCSLPLPLPILAFIVRHQWLPCVERRFNTYPYYKCNSMIASCGSHKSRSHHGYHGWASQRRRPFLVMSELHLFSIRGRSL